MVKVTEFPTLTNEHHDAEKVCGLLRYSLKWCSLGTLHSDIFSKSYNQILNEIILKPWKIQRSWYSLQSREKVLPFLFKTCEKSCSLIHYWHLWVGTYSTYLLSINSATPWNTLTQMRRLGLLKHFPSLPYFLALLRLESPPGDRLIRLTQPAAGQHGKTARPRGPPAQEDMRENYTTCFMSS